VHCSGPPAKNRSTQSIRRRCSSANCRSSPMIRLFSEGIFRRMGSSPSTDFFASLPKIHPITLRGGDFKPTAISSQAQQCAIIWATLIVPHCLWLSGLRRSIRSLISITEEASNKFFTGVSPSVPSHRLLITMRFSSCHETSLSWLAIAKSSTIRLVPSAANKRPWRKPGGTKVVLQTGRWHYSRPGGGTGRSSTSFGIRLDRPVLLVKTMQMRYRWCTPFQQTTQF
jgi:hypothetical protein